MSHEAQGRMRPTPLPSRLVRAVRRALWRHVGRFVTVNPPRYARGRPRDRAADAVPERRPLYLI
jgi:hypothetical protein